MMPYSRNIGGSYTRTHTTRVKSTGAVTQVVTTYFTTRQAEELTGITTGVGDFKTPLNQAYRATKNAHMVGRIISASENSFVTQVIDDEGCLGGGTQSYDMADPAEAYNQCLSDLNNKVRSSLDLSVSIAQAGQVVKSIRQVQDIVHYVRKFPSHALRVMFKDWKNDPKRLGSAWLEFQYGWKPLAQDVYDTVNNVLDGRINLTKVKQRTSRDVDNTYVTYSNGNTITDKVKRSTWVEIGLQLDISTSAATQLSNYSSLNPASLAWELTPFSFVVDWVYDIGGYIRSAETALLNSGRFVSGYRTTTERVENNRTVTGSYSTGQNTFGSTNMSGTYKRTQKSRVVLASYPFPRLPSFNARLGSGQLLNAAALLSQHLSR